MWCQSFDSANIFQSNVQWEGEGESEVTWGTDVYAQEEPGWISTHLSLCITPTIITNASTSFVDTDTETGGGEGYAQMLRDSMESIKVLNEEKCYSAVNNLALSLYKNMDFYHLRVLE